MPKGILTAECFRCASRRKAGRWANIASKFTSAPTWRRRQSSRSKAANRTRNLATNKTEPQRVSKRAGISPRRLKIPGELSILRLVVHRSVLELLAFRSGSAHVDSAALAIGRYDNATSDSDLSAFLNGEIQCSIIHPGVRAGI